MEQDSTKALGQGDSDRRGRGPRASGEDGSRHGRGDFERAAGRGRLHTSAGPVGGSDVARTKKCSVRRAFEAPGRRSGRGQAGRPEITPCPASQRPRRFAFLSRRRRCRCSVPPLARSFQTWRYIHVLPADGPPSRRKRPAICSGLHFRRSFPSIRPRNSPVSLRARDDASRRRASEKPCRSKREARSDGLYGAGIVGYLVIVRQQGDSLHLGLSD